MTNDKPKIWTDEERDEWVKAQNKILDDVFIKASEEANKMTKDQARIFLLEESLTQAYHTIEFLHGCLTDNIGHKYAYPEQTIQNLEEIKSMVHIRRGCPHSMIKSDCEYCIDRFTKDIKREFALRYFRAVTED